MPLYWHECFRRMSLAQKHNMNVTISKNMFKGMFLILIWDFSLQDMLRIKEI